MSDSAHANDHRHMLAAKAFFETPAAQLTPQMEEDFFSSLMTENKTYKTTFRDRFTNVNAAVVPYLRPYASGPINVLDIGISSGVSTIELYDDLRSAGIAAKIVATDLFLDAFLIRILPGCHALVDGKGYPLRFDLLGGTLKPWIVARDYRTGFFLVRKMTTTVLRRRARRILRDRSSRNVTPVRLVTPRLQEHAGIVVCSDDIGRQNDAFARRFDFVRAANVLNKGYFDSATLGRMTRNIAGYLKLGTGMLLVVRTHEDRSNHGTLFRVGDDARFEVVCRIGAGAEIEDIVLSS